MGLIKVPRFTRKQIKSLQAWDELNRWASDVDRTISDIIKSLHQTSHEIAVMTLAPGGTAVTAHASQHLPNGSDPLATAAPASVLGGTSSNATGTANSFSRSDHSHDVGTAAPAFVFGTAASEGTSNNLARVDAGVAIFDTTVPEPLGASALTGSAAFAARRDHVHPLPSSTTPFVTFAKWDID